MKWANFFRPSKITPSLRTLNGVGKPNTHHQRYEIAAKKSKKKKKIKIFIICCYAKAEKFQSRFMYYVSKYLMAIYNASCC